MGYRGIQWDTEGYNGIQRDAERYSGIQAAAIQRDTVGYL